MRWGEAQASAKRRMEREKERARFGRAVRLKVEVKLRPFGKSQIKRRGVRRHGRAAWGSRSLILIGKARLTSLAFVHCHGRDLFSLMAVVVNKQETELAQRVAPRPTHSMHVPGPHRPIHSDYSSLFSTAHHTWAPTWPLRYPKSTCQLYDVDASRRPTLRNPLSVAG
jgi:hypothetical protein